MFVKQYKNRRDKFKNTHLVAPNECEVKSFYKYNYKFVRNYKTSESTQ